MPALTLNPTHDVPHAHYDPQMFPPFHNQLLHKLWILDCKACGAFLTNRGMKAVLLLRPNVSLFSTDALPVNCSAYSANPEILRPPLCVPSSYPRTCECLTQTLCCHQCGASVGYMIVLPCGRCTSSIAANQRATNGHRFVFHSTELIATERHYIQDEPGVVPYDTPVTPTQVFYQTHQAQPLVAVPSGHPASPTHGPQYILLPNPDSSVQLPTPSPFPIPLGHTFSGPHRLPPRGPPRPFVPSQNPVTLEHKDVPAIRRLRPGDVLYWHHLARHGEIPGVENDTRARSASQHRPSFDR